MIFISPKFDL